MPYSLILLGLFLYFGYKDDYRRNPQAFVRAVVPIVALMLLALGILYILVLPFLY